MSDEEQSPLRFQFSVAAAAQAAMDTEQQIEAFDERIQKLVDHATVAGGMRIVEPILKMTQDPEELDRLGKVLQRLAEVLPQYEKLKLKQGALELAKSEPQWLAYAFGEFTDEIEADTHRFEKGDLSGF